MRERLHFLLLNIGHFLDHLFTLIFARVAALALYREWGLGYPALLKSATPGFFAFGVFALPAGWLADKWSREGMMSTFFIGIGLASIVTAFARTPLELALGLFVVGVFAAIYHPVGLAIVVEKWKNTGMRIAVNGVWGNLGVASAALITGYFIDHGGWRMAFILPGVISILIGIAYTGLMWREIVQPKAKAKVKAAARVLPADVKALLFRVYMIGRLAEGEWRARIYGMRYVVSFTALAAALPLIAFVYENWGFDALFRVLAVSAAVILGAVLMLPQRLPRAQPVPA